MVRSSYSSSSTGLSSDVQDWCCFTLPKSPSASRCLSLAGTTGPPPTSSSLPKSESPFSTSCSRFEAVMFAKCVYVTLFLIFRKEVTFWGLVERLEYGNSMCDRVRERTWRSSSPSVGLLARLFVRKSRNGVCALCEVVRARRRIVDIVGLLRVVRKLALTFLTARA
jgi:hypothetical protein